MVERECKHFDAPNRLRPTEPSRNSWEHAGVQRCQSEEMNPCFRQLTCAFAGVAFLGPCLGQSPRLVYGTYLGGRHKECATGIAVDKVGNAYVVGRTPSPDFPVTHGAFRSNTAVRNNDWTGFLSKLAPDGSKLLYSTFLGGNFRSSANSVDVDADQRAVVGGSTCSSKLGATPNALAGVAPGSDKANACDGFVVLMNATGSRPEYASYIGGSREDAVTTVTIDPSGKKIFVAGYTDSPDLPVTPDALQRNLGGGRDGFLIVIAVSSGKLLYGTYLGGRGDDAVAAIRLAPSGPVFVVGTTRSPGWPEAANRHQFGKGGNLDTFVLRVDLQTQPTLSAIRLGGAGDDAGSSIDLDASGDVYVAGTTNSADFPIRGGSSRHVGSGFVARIAVASSGSWSLRWSRRVGGTGEDALLAITMGLGSSVLVAGRSGSADFPTTSNAIHPRLMAQNDSVLVKLRATDGNIEYATFVGGTQVKDASWYNDEATSLHATPKGDLFLTGCTLGGRLKVSTSAFQPRPAGNSDPFVLRLDLQPTSQK